MGSIVHHTILVESGVQLYIIISLPCENPKRQRTMWISEQTMSGKHQRTAKEVRWYCGYTLERTGSRTYKSRQQTFFSNEHVARPENIPVDEDDKYKCSVNDTTRGKKRIRLGKYGYEMLRLFLRIETCTTANCCR